MNDSSKLIGENGGQFYDSTATLTGHWYAIECNADTVLSVLTEANNGGSNVDVTGSSEWNVSGKTLSQGVILTPYRDNFTSVALTSGSVILRKS